MPLILAFYCIVGGNDPLPEFGRDLYTKVLNRMLGSGWRIGDDTSGRNDEDSEPDADSCLLTLRAWAWSGATSNSISGVGTWADDILVGPSQLGKADEHALDNVATPSAGPTTTLGRHCAALFTGPSVSTSWPSTSPVFP